MSPSIQFRTKMRRFGIDLSIGPTYAFLNARRLFLQSCRSVDDPAVAELNRKRIRRLVRWGAKEFHTELDRWKDATETAVPFKAPADAPIWMIWLQGEDCIPEKYFPFLDSVRRNNPDHQIRILDLESVRTLVPLPEIIQQRYEEGYISPVLLTDYIRFALLEHYGGIWMDLTVYQQHPTPSIMLEYPMWCVKDLRPFPYASAMPDGLKWQSYYVASQPHALFCKVVLDLFESYFVRHTAPFDYFFIYYLAYFARTVPAVCQSYDRIPANNASCEQFMPFVESNDPITENTVNAKLVDSSTWAYKGSSHLNESEQHRCSEVIDILERIRMSSTTYNKGV